ncbi:hypothetical protein BK826_08075 [Rothia kristinae]|uniref:Uncharacterized protein n=1 Tax=Rothia kristinae TaxID=37923 RepID=A0A1S2MYN8_9MICC|nr:hypothetical protein [Rothia kristinae]OIJ35437.1 hypothetical protein BK826_08075 [Rothia kristinae]
MSKRSKALATTAAVAAGPSAIKRLAAGCLMVVLLGALILGALFGFAAWLSHRSEQGPESLPCPPATVAVAVSTQDAPVEVREAVEAVLREAGREPVEGGWGGGLERDLVVAWTPGAETRVSGGSNPTTITLGAVPTGAEVTEALGGRLAPCEAEAEPTTAPEPVETEEAAQVAPGGLSWPGERGWSTTGWLSLAVATWWLAGPNLVRGAWAALWPVRLGWRTAQRWGYRRGLARGVLPTEWPAHVNAGQRWHEDGGAMHDQRTYRQQITKGEAERRRALSEYRRAERLEGLGIGPAILWRAIYRAPAPEPVPRAGAPENKGVST